MFLAGASGVIGQRLIPRLIEAGHVVGGMTRSADKTELLSQPRRRADRLRRLRPRQRCPGRSRLRTRRDPQRAHRPTGRRQPSIAAHAGLNARIRTEGNQNLIEAARQSGSPRLLAQTVAWQLPDGPGAEAVAELERSVLAEDGVVLSYGQFYGPGTYHERQVPAEPRVAIDRAAERTAELLDAPSGVVVITD